MISADAVNNNFVQHILKLIDDSDISNVSHPELRDAAKALASIFRDEQRHHQPTAWMCRLKGAKRWQLSFSGPGLLREPQHYDWEPLYAA